MDESLLNLMLGIVFCLWSVQEVKSKQFVIHKGFITGNEYFDLISKSDYLVGKIDGIVLAPMFGTNKKIN